ncbi:MAG TPA: ATP-binding protein [Sunxiuqinia sp.]|nr:ATP-binding protein [Sunxiuqinia sp.]
MKTYSPKKLAFYLAQALTILTILFVIGLSMISFSPILYIVLILFYFALIFSLIIYIMRKYIDEKIDPIYKIISDIPVQEKKIKKEEGQSDLISSAKQEVEQWAENQKQEITRLKDLERYRKEFVGNVSHELKTPIFNIQGYILTLLEGGIDDPKINKLYLKRTEKSIDRMISIVEDLESITKLESGELKLKYESFDLAKLVEEVIEMEQMMAAERKIQLVFTNPEKPVMVRADKKRIFEVVANLVVNGIKYGRRKGKVKVSFYDLNNNLMVEVSDDGLGIEKRDLPRIFERFYRADKSRSRVQGGTGLGLSIVKHIIEAHEQTINVKSAVEEGTTFTFTLEKAK